MYYLVESIGPDFNPHDNYQYGLIYITKDITKWAWHNSIDSVLSRTGNMYTADTAYSTVEAYLKDNTTLQKFICLATFETKKDLIETHPELFIWTSLSRLPKVLQRYL